VALDIKTLALMLRSRLRLAEPDQQTDPLYKIPDTALEDIMTDAISTHNPLYSLSTLPVNEVQFVLWLGMIEVYYGIATESAAYYQIMAQGAQLNRQQIFDHFTLLAKQLQDKYDKAWIKFMTQTWEAQSVDIVIPTRYNPRTYRLMQPATIALSVIAQTPTTISLQWTPVTDRQIVGYRLLQYQGEIIDEFSPTSDLINPLATPVGFISDIYRFKYRIENLIAGSIYNFAVYVDDVYGHQCWSEIEIQQPLVSNTNNAPNPILLNNNSTPTGSVN
jgi:hypothetical protein